MKKEQKDELKKMSVKDLQTKLIELHKEKMKLETNMYAKNGTCMTVRNYPTESKLWRLGSIREVKKNMARVKTYINIKLRNEVKK